MAIAFSKALLDYCLADMAITTGKSPPKTVDLGKVYDLHWIDPALHEPTGEVRAVAEFERSRRFPHCGAAIAWARRQIFHGKVYGEHIEMRTVHRISVDGAVQEHEDEVLDITLPGFRRWGSVGNNWHASSRETGISLGKPERKCRATQ